MDPQTQAEWHEVMVKTRNVLAKRGHTKGVLEDLQGRVCLYGALSQAGPEFCWLPDDRRDKFAELLGFGPALFPMDAVQEAVDWNNDPERTEEEVLARLDEAANRLAPMPEDLPLPELVA